MIDILQAAETLVNFTGTSGTSRPSTACGPVGTINRTTPSMPSGTLVPVDIRAHVPRGLADGSALNTIGGRGGSNPGDTPHLDSLVRFGIGLAASRRMRARGGTRDEALNEEYERGSD
jgi:hypothetical protein